MSVTSTRPALVMSLLSCLTCLFFFFFFNDTATTEIYTLSLHDALPICDKDPGNVSVTNGIATLPILSGQTTVGAGGSHAGLTITSLSSGAHTCSGANAENGSGSSCVIQSAVTITLD